MSTYLLSLGCFIYLRIHFLSLRVVREDLGANVSPSNTRKTTNSKPSTKAAPTLCALKRITSNAASAEGLDANSWALRLEGNGTIHRKAGCEDENEGSSTQAARDFSSSFNVTERSELDEGSDEEESMGKTDLNAAEERGNTSTVGGEVGEVRSNQRGRGDGGLEHSNERISVDGLDYL